MRGKAILLLFCKFNPRITPAYAGKSVVEVHTTGKGRDHPRLCGEKFAQYDAAFWEWGSPPPMRGKGKKANCSYSVYRITPAYAGKSYVKN